MGNKGTWIYKDGKKVPAKHPIRVTEKTKPPKRKAPASEE